MIYRFYKNTFVHDTTLNISLYKQSNHIHTNFEILLFVSGKADYVVENQTYALSPFSLILTNPTEYHFISFKSDSEQYERYWVQFDLDSFPPEIANKLRTKTKVLQLDYKNRICKIFRIMAEYYTIFSPEKYPEFYQGLLTEMVFLISLETENNDIITIQEADEITAKALKYINEHITEPLSIERISEALFISPSTLCHKFSEYMKISVMQYVKKKKVYAAERLINQGIKPTVVSSLCGYTDYSSFYRAYKEVFGKLPRDKNR